MSVGADRRVHRGGTGRRSSTSGRPNAALEELRVTEQQIGAVLGHPHPLRMRARYVMCQATSQLLDHQRSRVMLAELHDEQSRAIGRYHPDTLATQLDLGIADALLGRHTEARRSITEATAHIGDELSWRADLRMRAEVTSKLMLLPNFAWQAFRLLTKAFYPPRQE
jgi:hypothetical protein